MVGQGLLRKKKGDMNRQKGGGDVRGECCKERQMNFPQEKE